MIYVTGLANDLPLHRNERISREHYSTPVNAGDGHCLARRVRSCQLAQGQLRNRQFADCRHNHLKLIACLRQERVTARRVRRENKWRRHAGVLFME
jgi:hypothetical protein